MGNGEKKSSINLLWIICAIVLAPVFIVNDCSDDLNLKVRDLRVNSTDDYNSCNNYYQDNVIE